MSNEKNKEKKKTQTSGIIAKMRTEDQRAALSTGREEV